MKANCPIRSVFSAKVTISCESHVQNRIFLLIYKRISPSGYQAPESLNALMVVIQSFHLVQETE